MQERSRRPPVPEESGLGDLVEWKLRLGALGWGIVAALGFSASRLGASTTLAVVVAAQIVAALVLDQIAGRVDIGIRQPVGVLLLVGGVLLVATRA